MKKKTIYHLIIVTICFLSLNGCATLDKDLGIAQFQPKRSVENNLFSSTFPELKLQISPDLKYLGSVQIGEPVVERLSDNTDLAANVEATSYLFGRMDRSNRLANGVLIRVLVMSGDPSQTAPAIFSKRGRHILATGEMKVLEERYQYELYAERELFTKKEDEALVRGRGPSCSLVKQLSQKAGFGNKSRVQILYFEDVSAACANQPCGTCPDPASRAAEQKQFLQGFTDRSYASMRFLKTRTVEDTTSRYVDAEPKVQPAPAETIQPRPAPGERVQAAPVERVRPAPVVVPSAPAEKASPAPVFEPSTGDAIEKKLETLKRIYERNLISKEDYEKKKAEILEGL